MKSRLDLVGMEVEKVWHFFRLQNYHLFVFVFFKTICHVFHKLYKYGWKALTIALYEFWLFLTRKYISFEGLPEFWSNFKLLAISQQLFARILLPSRKGLRSLSEEVYAFGYFPYSITSKYFGKRWHHERWDPTKLWVVVVQIYFSEGLLSCFIFQ